MLAGFKGGRRPSGRPAEQKGVFRGTIPRRYNLTLNRRPRLKLLWQGVSVDTRRDEEVESKDFVGISENLDRRIRDDTNMGCDTIGSKNWSNQLDMLSWGSKVDLSLTGVDTTATESFFLWTGVDLSDENWLEESPGEQEQGGELFLPPTKVLGGSERCVDLPIGCVDTVSQTGKNSSLGEPSSVDTTSSRVDTQGLEHCVDTSVGCVDTTLAIN
ncbi:hypothetical protein Taro_045902, partial [Colocasia esculenta]|nr:hypothetical protein [Colocasia esculenta]